MTTGLLTIVAMIAFAGNSLLNRLALHDGQIDAASFVTARLACGALALTLLWRFGASRGTPRGTSRGTARGAAAAPVPSSPWSHGSARGAAMLFIYAALFSFAYLALPAGTGALILFGSVQVTMLSAALRAGERFGAAGWLGFATAIAGLVYLLLPGIETPAPWAAAAMAIAGVAWGAYSLLGRGSVAPLAVNAGHFMRALPFALLLSALAAVVAPLAGPQTGAAALAPHATARGLALAAASGALTSGVGYAIWYAVLGRLTTLRAATVQLSVPLLAAAGGVLFLGEAVTPRLAIACVAIVGGIACVLAGRARRSAGQRSRAP